MGHQLVIDTALSQCARVVIISYSKPEFAGCDRAARARWLAQLYPQCDRLVVDDQWVAEWNKAHPDSPCPYTPMPDNDADEVIHRDFVGWLCIHALGIVVDAVFASEAYAKPFAEHLSRLFAAVENGDSAAPVTPVLVDEARRQVAVSGTALRETPQRLAAMVDPRLRLNLPGRIAILGGESSGKSTLTLALAERLNGCAVEEYGRTLWEEKKGDLTFDDMLHIAQTQVAAEDRAAMAGKPWVICDTSPLTTLFYCMEMFGRADPRLIALANRRYDHVIVCEPDFPFVQDGTRRDPAFRSLQHDWYKRALSERNMAYSTVHGTMAERLKQINALLSAA